MNKNLKSYVFLVIIVIFLNFSLVYGKQFNLWGSQKKGSAFAGPEQNGNSVQLTSDAKIVKISRNADSYAVWRNGVLYISIEKGKKLSGVLPPGNYALRTSIGSVSIYLETQFKPENITLWGRQNAIVKPLWDGNFVVLSAPTTIVSATYDGTKGMGIFLDGQNRAFLHSLSPHNIHNPGPKVFNNTGRYLGKTLIGQTLPPGVYYLVPGKGTADGRVYGQIVLNVGAGVGQPEPSFGWEPVSSGGNRVDISDNQICIEAMKYGTGYATQRRPYDFMNDYTVSFDFKLNEKNNHWFILYSDSFLHVHIDWGTALHYLRPPNTKIMNMEVARWYHFKLDAHPSKNSFDIYIDGRHVGIATNVKPGSVDVGSGHGTSGTDGAIGEWIYLGDAEKTSYNRGSGCWKNIMLSYTSAPPSKYHAVNHLSCKNNDNEEKGCCCFKGAHTYRFRAQYVSSVLARFDTGKKFNCRSKVQLQVDRGKGWETIKTIQAVSSSGDSELAPIDVEVPVNNTILGFRIFDGCVCCIDFSEIFLK